MNHTQGGGASPRTAMYRRLMGAVMSAAVGILVSSTTAHAQDAGIAVGTVAPSAAVQRLDGTALELRTLTQGGPAVLEFWATWCPLCRKLEPAMATARAKYAGKVRFIGVGVAQNQSAERQQAYVTQQQLSGDYVFDKDGAAVAAFKVPHTSFVVVLDRHGKVVYTGVGAEQDIDAAVRKALDPTGTD